MLVGNSSLNLTDHSGDLNKSSLSSVTMVIVGIIIIIGVVGNSFVVTIVAMVNSMKTTTNYLLVNVAVADIITLILTGVHMVLTRTMKSDNSFMCKVIDPNTLSNVALLATSINLAVISIERYNALVKPMLISRRLTTGNVLYVIIGIWIISLAMNLPVFIYIDYDPEEKKCSPGEDHNSLLVSVGGIVLVMMILPFLVIAFCYSTIICGLYFSETICKPGANPELNLQDLVSKRKLVKLLLTITIVFFFAFVPYGVLQISMYGMTGTRKENKNIVNLSRVIVYLIPAHASVNPFLYALQSNNYRQGFKVLAKKIMCVNDQDWSSIRPCSSHRTLAAISLRNDHFEL